MGDAVQLCIIALYLMWGVLWGLTRLLAAFCSFYMGFFSFQNLRGVFQGDVVTP